MIYRELAEEWLESRRTGKSALRISSLNNYSRGIRRVSEYLGKFGYINCDIAEYTSKKIQSVIDNLSEVYTLETVINYSKVISQPFCYARVRRYIPESPYNGIVITPKPEEVYKEVKIFYKHEIEQLLSLDCKKYKKDMIILAYRTGLRHGEILTLKWDDINFKEKYIFVQRTLSHYRNKNDYTIEMPKTRNSRRKVSLDNRTLQMLCDRYNQNHSCDWVFATQHETFYTRQAIGLSKLCDKAGIPRRPFHALRHSNATLLLLGGAEREIVQRRLGHASLSTTENTYCHVPLPMQKKAVDIVNSIN